MSNVQSMKYYIIILTIFLFSCKKDVGYIDGADNGQIKYKSVFIRTNDKFIEDNLSKYDSYASTLINKM